ncbi:hypothetical protein LQW54_008870 [Pestalotiopsis sp. IQ-011]
MQYGWHESWKWNKNGTNCRTKTFYRNVEKITIQSAGGIARVSGTVSSLGLLYRVVRPGYLVNPFYVFVSFNPSIKPKLTPLPLFYKEEDDGVSHESRRFILPLQKLSPTVNSVKAAKRSGRGNNKGFSTKGSEEHVLQTSTSTESQLNSGRNEKTDTSFVDAFGRLTVANWKCRGGKGKEWRKTPWESASSVQRGVPETFLKQYPSSKSHGWFSGRQPETKKFDHFALKSSTAEAVADLANVCSQWVCVEDEGPWPHEESNGSAQESGHVRMPSELDDNSKSQDNASFSLPSDSYSGAIIGGHFRLDDLLEEHETPGEKTYAVSDLMAPEKRLVARSYNILGLPREYREARKRHMKRLVRRENGCDVRQDGKIYIVHTYDALPSLSAATQPSAHVRIRQGTRPPGPSTALQDDTEFPPLSKNASQAKPNTFWDPTKVQGFFKQQKQKAPPTRSKAVDSLVPGQVSVSKRKRHRWRKAKKHDPPEPCAAADPKELSVLAGTDETSGPMAIPHPDMVEPSFGCLIEMDKHVENHAETIIAMAAEVEGCDLQAVQISVGNFPGVSSTFRTEVIDDIAMQELKFAEQNGRAQTVLRFMRHHLSVQTRRAEIYTLMDRAEWMREQLKEKSRLEHRLRVRLMKAKEGKSKERIKVIHASICKELDDINMTLEDGVRRKAEILAGCTALRA